jgi:hypothetical protein
MATCFVMQPFDRGKFDRRFDDVFGPAIKAAGLEPYRVDRDPGVSIPVEDIERGITGAEICFAEITTDNPNVWFELGYAIASGKPVCLVCSKERTTSFPFDVRHRTIIEYDVGSSSDFAKLGSAVTDRIRAMLERERSVATINSLTPATTTHGLSAHELSALAIIGCKLDSAGVSIWEVEQQMEKAGYTELAAGLAVRSLMQQGFATLDRTEDFDGREYTMCKVTASGVDWLLANVDNLSLRITNRAPPPDTSAW